MTSPAATAPSPIAAPPPGAPRFSERCHRRDVVRRSVSSSYCTKNCRRSALSYLSAVAK